MDNTRILVVGSGSHGTSSWFDELTRDLVDYPADLFPLKPFDIPKEAPVSLRRKPQPFWTKNWRRNR